jgi:hypothetical protein
VLSDGSAFTAEEAAAMAWVKCWSPDACMDNHVEREGVPLEVDDQYRFELTSPYVEV